MSFGSYVLSQNLENHEFKKRKTKIFLDSNYKETTNPYDSVAH